MDEGTIIFSHIIAGHGLPCCSGIGTGGKIIFTFMPHADCDTLLPGTKEYRGIYRRDFPYCEERPGSAGIDP
jgi:hypothetical protein